MIIYGLANNAIQIIENIFFDRFVSSSVVLIGCSKFLAFLERFIRMSEARIKATLKLKLISNSFHAEFFDGIILIEFL